MTKIYDLLYHKDIIYVVDDEYPVGGVFIGFSEREKNIHGIIQSYENNHVNGNWNTNWYYPHVPMGTFHVIGSTSTEFKLPILPPIEEDIKQLVIKESPFGESNREWNAAWVKGYKASAKKWTNEDMRNAMNAAVNNKFHNIHKTNGEEHFQFISNYIKSLTPQPIKVEVEIEEKTQLTITGMGAGGDVESYYKGNGIFQPKVDSNNQLIVKQWIYE